jgi:MYXO-CTERM domain-containing protein
MMGAGILAAAAVSLASPRADACGGTFCNTGINNANRQQAIDQTGENIIFVMEPGKVEAHIQIQYQGTAASFSWVLPVQALPEVEVGSQALFDRLLAATVPTYGYTTQYDSCGNFGGMNASGPAFGTGAGVGGGGSGLADAGVSVVLQKTVGAFEVTVLQGGTTQEVLAWLTANGYQAPTATPGLLDGYVANHYLFVAVKLTNGAGIDEIHPLVVRYAGTQPCVPLKLTAVAAVEDMGIRTFFLGTKRVVPKNYKHVVPNPVLLDWMSLGSNYKKLISQSVDSPVANGRAFVTEYAGPTAVVGANPIAQAQWDATAFTNAAAIDVIKILQQQGLLQCFGTQCSYANPLLLPLLRDYLPAPSLTDGGLPPGPNGEGQFYSCLAGIGLSQVTCDASTIDAQKWDGAKFAAALSSRIIEPARHADSLLTSWKYLTRLFTTISPAEMTEDPEFIEHDGLPNVRIQTNAVRRVTCTGASGMTLPDGRQVALAGGVWPGFSNTMPSAERIEEFPSVGASLVLVDNAERINSQLKEWNDSQSWPPTMASTPSGTGSGGFLGAGGASITGQGGAAMNDLTAGGGGSDGCSCRVGSTHARASGAWALAGALALFARRRRRDRVGTSKGGK